MIVPNHFPFVLGLKLLFSLLITQPAEKISSLTSSLTGLAISKPENAIIPSSI